MGGVRDSGTGERDRVTGPGTGKRSDGREKSEGASDGGHMSIWCSGERRLQQ
ncbi:Hypothetical predicted protein, partial [Pelobates cultripes]